MMATRRGVEVLSFLYRQIILLEGKKGRGKTLSAVAIAYNLREMFGAPVVVVGTRLGLTQHFGPYTYLNEKDFIAQLDTLTTVDRRTTDDSLHDAVRATLKRMGVVLDDATLVFDEAYRFFDSREPGSKLVRIFGFFVSQSRHYGNTIILIAPDRDMLDKRIRRQIDFYGRCFCRCVSVPVEGQGLTCIVPNCGHQVSVRFVGSLSTFRLVVNAPRYWPMYNTLSVVGFRESHLQVKV